MDPRRQVILAGGEFTVVSPAWLAWQAALERAAARNDGADAAELLAEVLLTAVQTPEGTPVRRSDLEALPAADGDALMSALLDLLEEQRRALGLTVKPYSGWTEIEGKGAGLRLTPWTFGARNAALRMALCPAGNGVALDMAAFDRAMVLTCVTLLDGRPLTPEQVAAWPVPLGEAVMAELDRLCGVGAGEEATLLRCIETGAEHPDLALLRLCRAFGWSPAEVEEMDARLAERLLTLLRIVEPSPASASPRVESRGEGVTRILVHDD